jgi:hypothetical protein
MQVGIGFGQSPPALELVFPRIVPILAHEMLLDRPTVIDAWKGIPYTKGMGFPLVLGEPGHRRLNQGDSLSSMVDAAQFDIALVRRRFWKTATFQEQVGVRTGSRLGSRWTLLLARPVAGPPEEWRIGVLPSFLSWGFSTTH